LLSFVKKLTYSPLNLVLKHEVPLIGPMLMYVEFAGVSRFSEEIKQEGSVWTVEQRECFWMTAKRVTIVGCFIHVLMSNAAKEIFYLSFFL
jgi:hypothetical protein